MLKKVRCDQLFEHLPSMLSPFTKDCAYPWEILCLLKKAMDAILLSPPEGYRFLKENVLIGEDVVIAESAVIYPPAVIGAGTEIRPGAYLRGYVFIGENCVIGNSSELKHCILMDRAQVPHYNYVGDSILGYRAHMGAGAVCSNLKSDGSHVVVHGEEEFETGMRKLGAILGDGAEIGCGCVLNPGTVIGMGSSAYPLTSLRGVYPEGYIIKGTKEITKRK